MHAIIHDSNHPSTVNRTLANESANANNNISIHASNLISSNSEHLTSSHPHSNGFTPKTDHMNIPCNSNKRSHSEMISSHDTKTKDIIDMKTEKESDEEFIPHKSKRKTRSKKRNSKNRRPSTNKRRNRKRNRKQSMDDCNINDSNEEEEEYNFDDDTEVDELYSPPPSTKISIISESEPAGYKRLNWKIRGINTPSHVLRKGTITHDISSVMDTDKYSCFDSLPPKKKCRVEDESTKRYHLMNEKQAKRGRLFFDNIDLKSMGTAEIQKLHQWRQPLSKDNITEIESNVPVCIKMKIPIIEFNNYNIANVLGNRIFQLPSTLIRRKDCGQKNKKKAPLVRNVSNEKDQKRSHHKHHHRRKHSSHKKHKKNKNPKMNDFLANMDGESLIKFIKFVEAEKKGSSLNSNGIKYVKSKVEKIIGRQRGPVDIRHTINRKK